MRLALFALPFIAACTIPETMEGAVHEITDKTVTIRGAYDMTPTGGHAKPTLAMIDQAKEICTGAQYLSATPSPTDDYTFLYLFRC